MLASKSKRLKWINHTILHQNTPPIPSRLIAFTNYWNKMAFNMKLSHAGLALFLIGVLLSNTYKIQLTQILRFGSQISLGTQICCLRGIDQNYGPTFHSICGNLVVYQQASTQTVYMGSRAPNTVGEWLLSFFEGKDAYRRGGQEARLSHWLVNDGVFYHRHEVPKGLRYETMDITRHWEFTQSLNTFQRVLCLFPEKRFFFSNSELSTTKVAIHTNLFTDLYCLIGAGSAETGWYTTIMRLPFIFCIWIGFLLAAIGGISSLSYQVQKVKLKWI
jgi:cytochrome c biogenesis factor